MFRFLFFAGLGIITAAIGLSTVGVVQALGPGLAVGLPLVIISTSVLVVGRGTQHSPKVSAQALHQARQDGRIGYVRVVSLRQTNTWISNQPLCDLVLTVAPPAGSVYRARLRQLLAPTDIPSFQPGTVHQVAFFGQDQHHIAFTAAAEQHSTNHQLSPAPSGGQPLIRLYPARLTRRGHVQQQPSRATPRHAAGALAMAGMGFVLGAVSFTLPYHQRPAVAFEMNLYDDLGLAHLPLQR